MQLTTKEINELIQSKALDIDKGKISDGYHDFQTLYEHRIILYIMLCKQIQNKHYVWRSVRHSDGTEIEGWFILGIFILDGKQITYHLPNNKWQLTNFAHTHDKAPSYDGHTSEDVLKRLLEL